MVVSQKIENQSTSRPSNTILGHITKGSTIIQQRHLLNYVYTNIICKIQTWNNLHAYQLKNKENVVLLHNGNNSDKANNHIMKYAGKWMGLEKVIMNKVTKNQKDKYGMFSCISEY